jgi:hypothetical protein
MLVLTGLVSALIVQPIAGGLSLAANVELAQEGWPGLLAALTIWCVLTGTMFLALNQSLDAPVIKSHPSYFPKLGMTLFFTGLSGVCFIVPHWASQLLFSSEDVQSRTNPLAIAILIYGASAVVIGLAFFASWRLLLALRKSR